MTADDFLNDLAAHHRTNGKPSANHSLSPPCMTMMRRKPR